MEWYPFEVDGETFYWTAYPSKSQSGDGPWVDNEYLNVSRAPNTKGIGRIYSAGTTVTVEDAVDTVKLFKAHGRLVP